METNHELKSVWVLVYNDLGGDGMRKVYGVYADEDLANMGINALYTELYNGSNYEVEEFYDIFDPEIKEHIIQY